MKLTGWQRLGTIASISIILVGSVMTLRDVPFIKIDAQQYFDNLCKSETKLSDVQKCYNDKDADVSGLSDAMIIKRAANTIVLPLILLWGLGSISVFSIRWIRKGFA